MKKKLQKAYEISDARITHVSLVDKAANLHSFLIAKQGGNTATFQTYGKILKTDADTHYVTGIVYEPMTEDSDGNYMTATEIEKAQRWFTKNGNKVDLQHSFEPLENVSVVESWIEKADTEINGQPIKQGTWLMTMEIQDDAIWQGITKGDITGFSMGGMGMYSMEDTDLDTVAKADKSVLKRIAESLGFQTVEKGQVMEVFQARAKSEEFWAAWDALQSALRSYDWNTDKAVFETDETKIREALDDFNKIITDLLTGGDSILKSIGERPVDKAGKTISAKNREFLSGLHQQLGDFLDGLDADDEDTKKKTAKEPDPKDDEDGDDKGNDDEGSVKKSSKGGESDMTEADTRKLFEEMAGEWITKSVNAAVDAIQKQQEGDGDKAAAAPETPELTPEQIQKQQEEMMEKTISKTVEEVLKARGLAYNMTPDEAPAEEEHYLHGLL